jgi:prevent-host-death family protein
VAASVDVRDAKTHFSKLLARVMRGQEIVIAKAGKPVARLIPERSPANARRVPGIDKGKLKIAGDFDEMSTSELDEWYRPSVLPK